MNNYPSIKVKINRGDSPAIINNVVQKKLTNYLRTCRKRGHLSQDEVAFLLGGKSGSKVSRYERFTREPSLQTAMAFEVIYGVLVRELFAGVFQRVESRTVKRARLLARRLGKTDSNRLAVIKLKILQQFIETQKTTAFHEFN